MQTPASDIIQSGDLGGQKVAMGFDPNSLAHLMSVLTDLYSDPVGAIVREYSTNALDSHVEAAAYVSALQVLDTHNELKHFDPRYLEGGMPPIEVSIPSTFSPFFKVVDHGIGLSVDDITTM